MTLPKQLKGLDWDFISTWSFRLFMAGSAFSVFYFATIFAKVEDVAPLRQLPAKVEALEVAHKDYSDWRRAKDEVDTRLVILFDTQQRQTERLQKMIDRQQDQIDELNRRRP